MALLAALFAVFSTVIIPIAGCSAARQSEHEREGEHEEEREGKYKSRRELPKPMAWGGGMIVEPVEGFTDTVRFHIGSPLFLRLKINGGDACRPFNGQPFYFDASGAQLGWGFEEVTDSLIFPRAANSCERIVMLSSESSNRIAEGSYTFKTLIFIDAANRLYSDTIPVHAVRSTRGADTLTYARFLQELIIRNSTVLHDPETIRALFADGTPRSAESEIYRAAILLRAGDPAGAQTALTSARTLAERRGRPLDQSAAAARDAIGRALLSSNK